MVIDVFKASWQKLEETLFVSFKESHVATFAMSRADSEGLQKVTSESLISRAVQGRWPVCLWLLRASRLFCLWLRILGELWAELPRLQEGSGLSQRIRVGSSRPAGFWFAVPPFGSLSLNWLQVSR